MLQPSERTRVQGLPVTTPQRTLHDLAGTHPELLTPALNEAHARGLVRLDELRPVAGRRGARALRAALEEHPGVTRSAVERSVLTQIARAGLPRPETNEQVGRYEADLLWREQKVVVEIDVFSTHGTRDRFERDRRKDSELRLAGYEVLRFTRTQTRSEPERVIATLATALAR